MDTEIVFNEKNNEPFTTSSIIAEFTGVQHHTITRLIQQHEQDFNEFGLLRFQIDAVKSEGYRGTKYTKTYQLNEQQATLLMTYLRNTEKVRAFKIELVRQFYIMREALRERQSTEWMLTRRQGKLIRRAETDTLYKLGEYAAKQGSRHMQKEVYRTYTKLVNSLVGIEAGERERASFKTLSVIAFLEDMILHTVEDEMSNGTYYKEIYRKCKENGESIMKFAYLPNSTHALNG